MRRIGMVVAACAALFLAAAPRLAAQAGSVEFVIHASPSGGLEEPVRGFPIYLLTKSFEEIQKEADDAFPKEDLGSFIDKLTVSKELKDWMKRTHCVTFSGEEFIEKIKPDDVMAVPEFYQAYIGRNSGDQTAGFPEAKFKPSEKEKNPDKYAKDVSNYRDSVHKYLEQSPESINGIDLNLAEIDPSRKWHDVQAKRDPQVRRRIEELAEGKYLAARTETNLQGQGFFPNVSAGTYWLSTLDVPATVGDVRPRWDVPLTVRTGEVAYAVLSNVNAVQETANVSAP